MLSFEYITKEDIKEHNSNLPQIPDHPYRILIVGGSGSGGSEISIPWLDIDKIYLCAKNPHETNPKY